MSESERAQALMLNDHVSWQGTAVRLAAMVDELAAALAVAERERDALRAAAEAVVRSSFPDDRQAWTVQERKLADALAALAGTEESDRPRPRTGIFASGDPTLASRADGVAGTEESA